ncbi:dihydropteroate synthase [Jonesia denitrificans]|jgi:dihydropteroate synthase|nr:dihydropteroate synthase [Jonesia denitrificans]ASE10107.1 dihydropteroate synthase [Jonesia denitrificans]QXB44450.1 dihydropteroate synthase [Jonesia denitrificans]
MGVVNVTPDSFSDGGRHFDAHAGVAHGLALVAQGADIVDVGGESTRPGAPRVAQDEELRRVLPVVEELAQQGVVVSVDTTRASVAQAAVQAGAVMINDVSGGLADSDMAGVAAETGAVYVAMHWRGHAQVMDDHDRYVDVVSDVSMELLTRVENLRDAGVSPDNIVVDPGLGFSKTGANNWPLLRHVAQLNELGYPLLIGASRKRFLGRLLAGPDGQPVPPSARDDATAAVTALVAAHGAWCVRVHDVAKSVAAARVGDAWAAS